MATVIGIFEDHYKSKKPLPIVKPGNQTRRFNIFMILLKFVTNWKKNHCRHYSIANHKSYSILDVAKMFGSFQKSDIYQKDLEKDMLQH